jgi:serine/threonine protein kinase
VRGKHVDGRSDLFSYGVCLYEMITGEKPFGGENITAIIYRIMNEEPIPPRKLDPSIHVGLSSIVLKCLAKDPAQRFQNGAELVEALENYELFPTAIDDNQSANETVATPPPAPLISAPAINKPAHTSSLSDSTVVLLQKSPAPAPTVRKLKLWHIPLAAGVITTLIITSLVLRRSAPASGAETPPVAADTAATTPPAPPVVAKRTVVSKPKPNDAASAPSTGSAPKPKSAAPAVQPRKSGFFGKVFGKERIPAGKGLLLLKSKPQGATVFLNNKQSATATPLREPLDPGVYRIMFRLTGYKAEFRELTVEKGMITEITVDMEASK